MGLMLGHQAQQKRLLELAQQLVDEDGASQDLKDAAKAWIDSVNDAALSKEASKTFVVELEKSDLAAAKEILANKSFLTKKSFWIFGGDGWAYDIGFVALTTFLLPARTSTSLSSTLRFTPTPVVSPLRLPVLARLHSSLQLVRTSSRRTLLRLL